ncbi:MAG TPA: VWA domain-containing protein [Gemmatimonadaceae bacterium]|nr:VWA domain-containing protein [Gemmatimonadaceae bacterium]
MPVPRDLVTATVDLCRALRERGVAVTPAESIDAISALEHVDLGDRVEVRRAFEIVLANRHEDVAVVGELFDAMWGGALVEQPLPDASRARISAPPLRPPDQLPPLWSQRRDRGRRTDEDEDGDPVRLRMPSDRQGVRRRDLATLRAQELETMLRIARRLARRLARRPSRRWKPSARGSAIDLRRTARGSLRTGGETTEIAFRERRIRKAKLTVVCDVSGSMDVYGRFLLSFLYALQSAFARVESFVFATRLHRVTEQLQGRVWTSALEQLAMGVDEWSGGTRIGANLAALSRDWPHVLDRRTIVVILSDGWDTGEPAQLGAALEEIRGKVGKVIWLNPLLGSPEYRPLARGMQAALPHVDVFAPAHDLESLERLARHLVL